MLQITTDPNAAGIYAFTVAAPYELLGQWLTADVCSSFVGREWLRALREATSGLIPSAEGTGNAFTLIIHAESSRIECEYADDVLDLPTSLVEEALVRFIEFRDLYERE